MGTSLATSAFSYRRNCSSASATTSGRFTSTGSPLSVVVRDLWRQGRRRFAEGWPPQTACLSAARRGAGHRRARRGRPTRGGRGRKRGGGICRGRGGGAQGGRRPTPG